MKGLYGAWQEGRTVRVPVPTGADIRWRLLTTAEAILEAHHLAGDPERCIHQTRIVVDAEVEYLSSTCWTQKESAQNG